MMSNQKYNPWKSRKFLLSLFALAWYILSSIFNIHVPLQVQGHIATIVMMYVGAEGGADVVERFRSE